MNYPNLHSYANRTNYTSFRSKSCSDINECLENNGKGKCEHKCINEIGKYRCACPGGYKVGIDGHSCEDINECDSDLKNPCQHVCENLKGGYVNVLKRLSGQFRGCRHDSLKEKS